MGEAIEAYDRALRLAPDLHTASIWKAWGHVRWSGQLDSVRAVLDRVPATAPRAVAGDVLAHRATLLLWERHADSVLALPAPGSSRNLEGELFFTPVALYAGWAHGLRGDTAAARATFRSALAQLDSALSTLPDDWRVHAARGAALAGLGRHDEARREVRWLRETTPFSRDGFYGPPVAEQRARILAQAGDLDGALAELEPLLTGPSWLTIHVLRLDPVWDPLREHPRFQALVRTTRP